MRIGIRHDCGEYSGVKTEMYHFTLKMVLFAQVGSFFSESLDEAGISRRKLEARPLRQELRMNQPGKIFSKEL